MSFRAFCYNKPPNGHLFCPLDIMVGLLINYPDHCIVANITSKEHKAAYCYEFRTLETYYSESHTDVIFTHRTEDGNLMNIFSLPGTEVMFSRCSDIYSSSRMVLTFHKTYLYLYVSM